MQSLSSFLAVKPRYGASPKFTTSSKNVRFGASKDKPEATDQGDSLALTKPEKRPADLHKVIYDVKNPQFHRQLLYNAIEAIQEFKNRGNEAEAKSAYLLLKNLLGNKQIQSILNEPDKDGKYALDYAFEAQSPLAIKMLAQQSAHKISDWDNALSKWNSYDIMESLAKLAQTEPKILNITNGRRQNLLIPVVKTALCNDDEYLKTILEPLTNSTLPEQINHQDSDGNNILHHLLNIKSKFKEDLLYEEKIRGSIIKLLLKKGIRVNQTNNYNELPVTVFENLIRDNNYFSKNSRVSNRFGKSLEGNIDLIRSRGGSHASSRNIPNFLG